MSTETFGSEVTVDTSNKGESITGGKQTLTSSLSLNEIVYFSFEGVHIEARVRTVTFTNGKVRYSLQLRSETGKFVTTIHNVDSILVEPIAGELASAEDLKPEPWYVDDENLDNYS